MRLLYFHFNLNYLSTPSLKSEYRTGLWSSTLLKVHSFFLECTFQPGIWTNVGEFLFFVIRGHQSHHKRGPVQDQHKDHKVLNLLFYQTNTCTKKKLIKLNDMASGRIIFQNIQDISAKLYLVNTCMSIWLSFNRSVH